MYNPEFSIFKVYSGILKIWNKMFVFLRTKRADADKEKRQTAWHVRSHCWWCHSVYVCKCTCVCFHLCAPLVCVLLSLCLLFGNAKHHFRPNVASWTHESEFKDPSCGRTCSYQLVMKFKRPVVWFWEKKTKTYVHQLQLFLSSCVHQSKDILNIRKCKLLKACFVSNFGIWKEARQMSQLWHLAPLLSLCCCPLIVEL